MAACEVHAEAWRPDCRKPSNTFIHSIHSLAISLALLFFRLQKPLQPEPIATNLEPDATNITSVQAGLGLYLQACRRPCRHGYHEPEASGFNAFVFCHSVSVTLRLLMDGVHTRPSRCPLRVLDCHSGSARSNAVAAPDSPPL